MEAIILHLMDWCDYCVVPVEDHAYLQPHPKILGCNMQVPQHLIYIPLYNQMYGVGLKPFQQYVYVAACPHQSGTDVGGWALLNDCLENSGGYTVALDGIPLITFFNVVYQVSIGGAILSKVDHSVTDVHHHKYPQVTCV